MSITEMSEEELVKKMAKESGKTEEEIKSLAREKIEEFSGLISMKGALYIIGKDLGIEISKPRNTDLKIANIVSGMNNVSFKAVASRVFEEREFNGRKGKGRFKSIIFSDETGSIRLTLWNDEIDKYEIEEGKTYRITGAYTRKGLRSDAELRFTSRTRIEEIDEEIEIVTGEEAFTPTASWKDCFLDEAREGDFISTRASLVQVFERDPILEVCPECRKKAVDGECEEHGKVEPEKRLVISGVVDDGYGSMNAVFFGEQAEEVIGKKTKDVERELKRKKLSRFFKELDVLGREYRIKGVVRKSRLTGKPELLVRVVEKIDIPREIESLLSRVAT